MHRITLPDGSTRQSAFLRWARTVAYLLMAVSGTLLLLSNLLIPVYGLLGEFMAWFLVVGGMTSAFGTATVRWVGEFVGLPLLAPSFAIFGALVFQGSIEAAPYIAWGNLCLLGSIAVVMTARWRVVLSIFHIAVDLGKDPNDE